MNDISAWKKILAKYEENEKKYKFWKCEAESTLTISEFILRGLMQLQMFIYEVAENFTGYPNMVLLFPKHKVIRIKYRKCHVQVFFSRRIVRPTGGSHRGECVNGIDRKE